MLEIRRGIAPFYERALPRPIRARVRARRDMTAEIAAIRFGDQGRRCVLHYIR